MIAAGQTAQHPSCICVIRRFSEQLSLYTDYRVGSEDGVIRRRKDDASLLLRNSLNEGVGLSRGLRVSGTDVGWTT